MTNNVFNFQTITVSTRSNYDVLVGTGLLDICGDLIANSLKRCSVAVVTDDIVDALYSEKVIGSLQKSGFSVCKFVFKNGESSKNAQTYFNILNFLAEQKLTRSDMIVALGGGVVGDMAGFAAATYLRGIRFVQIPTTLLAQIDSSVGGKTAIDLAAGKNLVGAFHQPSLVVCDTDVLSTLPKDVFDDGMGEFYKYMLLDKTIFDAYSEKGADVRQCVSLCIDYKRRIVEADEFEKSERKLLNLGHTPAHGIEKLSNYTISHGKAVLMGLYIILDNSLRLSYLDKADYDRISVLFPDRSLYNCPYSIDSIMDAAVNDKKRNGDKITLVMIHSIGDVRLHEIALKDIKEYIK